MTDRRRNILLLVLSLAAGCVDAIAFVNTGAFPANMTGNSVMLGLALVRANTDHATLSFLALAGYCAGVIAAAWLMPTIQNGPKWTRSVSLVFLIAGLFLLACAISLKVLDSALFSWLVILSSAAMGMQSAAVLRLGVPGVSTTVITGTLTTGLVRLTGKFRQPKNSPGSSSAEPWLPMLSWGLYLAGGLFGGIQSVWHQNWILLLPGLLLVAVAVLGEWPKKE